MIFKENPYYSPQLCGLEIFKGIDTGQDYEYDMFVIWKKVEDNTLYWDTDSGNSCPCPFDNVDHGHNLKLITKNTFFNFKQALENHYNIHKEEVEDTIRSVKKHLNIK